MGHEATCGWNRQSYTQNYRLWGLRCFSRPPRGLRPVSGTRSISMKNSPQTPPRRALQIILNWKSVFLRNWIRSSIPEYSLRIGVKSTGTTGAVCLTQEVGVGIGTGHLSFPLKTLKRASFSCMACRIPPMSCGLWASGCMRRGLR